MRTQDGGISSEVLKVVHDDGHKEVQHLWEPQGPRGSGGVRDPSKHVYTKAQRERRRKMRWGEGDRPGDGETGTETETETDGDKELERKGGEAM